MQVAESKGLPKLKYHLLPRTKGFTTALQCLKGTGLWRDSVLHMTNFNPAVGLYLQHSHGFVFSVQAVYDVTLNFKDKETPTLLGIINGKKYKADMRVRWV